LDPVGAPAAGRHPDARPAFVPDAASGRVPGRVIAGTSGFAYPGWTPRFYPAGLGAPDRLRHYASRLAACELNTTFYGRPTVARIKAWCAVTPPSFRFVVKAQRGASIRALSGAATDSVPWLTSGLSEFGERLGAVLYRIPAGIPRRGDQLAALLGSWPTALPLVVEAQDASWHVDETFAALRGAGAVLCATDLDELDTPPDIRRSGPFLYVRLRRTFYDDADLDAWARRLVPFLDDGLDAYVLFRHDVDGTSAIHAEGFAARVDRVRASG
jgi:uncharacterized protein YecE (DUF72 family)